MIHVTVDIKTNPNDSIYQFEGGRKKFTYQKLLGFLISERGMDSEVATEEIVSAWETAAIKSLENPDVFIPELRKKVKLLFKYFRWYSDTDGSVSFFLKVSRGKEVYTLTKDPMKGSSAVMWDNGKTLEDNMREAYLDLAKDRDLDFVFGNNNEQDSSEGNVKILPTIAEYWEKFIYNIWLSDTYFRLDKRPVEITTDPKEPTYFFFDESVLEDGEHPVWDDWMLRIEDHSREVFMAWVYSIFDHKNKGRQMVWLYSHGYDGKTSVTNALSDFMEDKCVGAISQGSLNTQFGYSTIYGKRLVVYGDNKNPKLIHMEKISNILGADKVNIERKGVDAFMDSIYCKMLVSANIPPEVALSERSEVTRMLFFRLIEPPDRILAKYCELDAKGKIMRYGDGTPKYVGGDLDKQLLAELPRFLNTCKEVYERICPKRKDIPLTEGMYKELHLWCASPEHLSMEQFIEEKLVIDKDASCKKSELTDCFTKYKKGKRSSFDLTSLISFLNAVYKVDQDMDGTTRLLIGCDIADKVSTYSGNKKSLGSTI